MILATVYLNERRIAKQNARELAKELLDFLEAHLDSGSALFQRRADFAEYPRMKGAVASLEWRRTDGFDWCHWTCQNISFGFVGINLGRITSAIADKNKEAAMYNWCAASEKWLLIAASGSHPSNAAGPANQQVNWSDANLAVLCRESPFDKIFFWDRGTRWYKSLKPDETVVEYRVSGRKS
jgi:hypothetical protein